MSAGLDRAAAGPSRGIPPASAPARIDAQALGVLAGTEAPRLRIDGLDAGYGRSEVLHGVDLRLAKGQSLCLVGPNGAGKSTLLNAVFGMADVRAGTITVEGRVVDPRMSPAGRLAGCGIAYVLQESSIFPDLSVEQNLALGGYVLRGKVPVEPLVEAIFEQHPRLAARRKAQARVLSGGERRMLEIARALMVQPRLLLIDEPSIGLEPRAVEQVFQMLRERQEAADLSILLVEQNLRQGLQFADLGYVLVAGRVVAAGAGRELLADPALGRYFLGH